MTLIEGQVENGGRISEVMESQGRHSRLLYGWSGVRGSGGRIGPYDGMGREFDIPDSNGEGHTPASSL